MSQKEKDHHHGENRKRKILWYWSCLCLVPFTLFSLYTIPDYIKRRQDAKPDYAYPNLWEFKITLYSLLVFVPSRYFLSNYLFRNLGDRILPSAASRGWSDKERSARLNRFGHVVYKFCYFIFATAAGFYVLMDSDFFPAALGGNGDPLRCFEHFPFGTLTPYLKEYYLIQLGYHSQSLLFHIFGEHRNDYIEMILHHTCAVLLIFFSYVSNYIRIGSLVLILHDIADVFAYLLKTSVDTNYTKWTLVNFSALLFVWAYTRFYVFPSKVIGAIYSSINTIDPHYFNPFEYFYFLGLLYILLFLHIYWYALFLLAGYSYKKTGITQDLQHKVGGEVKAKKSKHSNGHSNGRSRRSREDVAVGADANTHIKSS